MAKVKDPVCGMMIEPDDAVASVQHEGRTHYFCSHECKEAFEEDPESYAG